MSIQLPKPGHRSTFLMLGYGLAVFLWMSLEDKGTLSVAILGTGLVILITLNWLLQRIGGVRLPVKVWFPGAMLLGAGLGAGSVLTTVLLMFFKTGWHQHGFADYPPLMILAMLQRLPLWSLAGLLVGLALALITLATRTESSKLSDSA